MTAADPNRPTLYAIYDLGRSPITFDVMNFFAFAHIWARRSGFGGYHVIFVLGEAGGFRDMTPKDKALDRDEKMWRLRHVLLPHAAIARHCIGVSVIERRVDLAGLMRALHPKQVFPPGYTVEKPNHAFMLGQLFSIKPTAEEFHVFEAPAAALRKVDTWLARHAPGGRPVVLTLRSSDNETKRNSRIDEWLAAASAIAARGYDPVIVPDTDLVTAGADQSLFGSVPVFGIGAVDLELRVAMFRRACLNIADNGGPAFLSFFMEGARMLCFLPVDKLPSVVGPGGVDRMAQLLGIATGGDFPHAGPLCRFVWRPDRCDAILEEFDRAVAHMAEAGAEGAAP